MKICTAIFSFFVTLTIAKALTSQGYKYLLPQERSVLPVIANASTEKNVEEMHPQKNIRGSNGYEYRTVRRLKYRNRTQRDVSHIFGEQQKQQKPERYLPPFKNDYFQPDIDNDDSIVILPVDAEVSNTEEPITEAIEISAVPEVEAKVESSESTQEAADGYHYKRPEMLLPPMEERAVEGPAEENAFLANDGYHYSVIKRLRF